MEFVDIIFKFTTIILIPLIVYGISKFKKSVVNQMVITRDIRDLKKYTLAICNELKIYCTLDDK